MMVQAQTQPLTFEEFLASYPEDGGVYELINGEAVVENPTGQHEEVVAFIVAELNFEIRRLGLSYLLPRTCTLKPAVPNTGYKPDIAVLRKDALAAEPQWASASTILQGSSVPLVVEVVSTNWRDDYDHKRADYEAMGIPEYWIVDYLGQGGRRYLGVPKQPTVTLCKWVEGEYQTQQLRQGDRLISPTFSELQLNVSQILSAGVEPN
ncbi:MAG: Uma2 family endonuclease [Cyanobacteria bacterium P01_D01_bin.123]